MRQLQLRVLEFANRLQTDYKNKFLTRGLIVMRLIGAVNRFNSLIVDCFEGQFRCPYVLSLNYAIIFRLTKISFYLHLRKIYFGKKEDTDLLIELTRLLNQLKESAEKENANFKKYYRSCKAYLLLLYDPLLFLE